MMSVRNASLRTKMVLAFLALIALAAIPGGYSIYTFQKTVSDLTDIREETLEGLRLIRTLAGIWNSAQAREVKLRVLRAPQALGGLDEQNRAARETFQSLLDHHADSAHVIQILETDWNTYLACLQTESELIRQARWKTLDVYAADTVVPQGRAAAARVQDLRDSFEEQLSAMTVKLESKSRQASTLNAFHLLAALLAAICLAVLLADGLVRPLRLLKIRALRMSKGDFGEDVPVNSEDETGKLTRAFNYMQSQLKELDQLKSEFIAVASHELRTPVTVLTGYVEMLQEGLLGDVPAKMKEPLAVARKESARLIRMFEELLDISKIQNGTFRLNLAEVAISEFAADTIRAFAGHEWSRKNRFTHEIAVQRPAALWDADRIREVLDNLFTNACKFAPSDGHIHLKVSEDPAGIHFSVSDNGPGIPPDQAGRIFEKFYQIERAVGRRAKGMGLGLALAKGIVEAHGGVISVTSMVGRGATFTVTVPPRAPDSKIAGGEP